MGNVVNKEQVTRTLFAGGKIHYDLWEAKPYLYEYDNATQSFKLVGTIQFNTYLKLNLAEDTMKLPLSDPKSSPFCKLKRYDAWCGYDEFTLRPEFVKFYGFASDDKTRKMLEQSIWR